MDLNSAVRLLPAHLAASVRVISGILPRVHWLR
jgi:hypothetical protein